MSEYFNQLAQLQKSRCTTCGGTGECDDAEPGDIYYNKWVCGTCKGSGLLKDPCTKGGNHEYVHHIPATFGKKEYHECNKCGRRK